MEEEETVISRWQRSDSETQLNQTDEISSMDKHLQDDTRKENIDLNSWRSKKDGRSMELGIHDSEDDEITLDDDILSRLIEGDTTKKSHKDSDSLTMTSPRPKPKPRHKEFSNDKKESSADKLFSGKQQKLSDEQKISPRPVPRPRSKPFVKEDMPGSHQNGQNSLGNSGNSSKLGADKLFDSIGKANKSVSFSDLGGTKDALPKSDKNHKEGSGFDKGYRKKQSNELNGDKQKLPPQKPARTKVKSPGSKKGKISEHDASDSDDSKEASHLSQHRKPTPRQPRQNIEKHNMPGSSHRASLRDSFDKHNRTREPHSPQGRPGFNGFIGPDNSQDNRESFSLHVENKDTPYPRQMGSNDIFVERMRNDHDGIRTGTKHVNGQPQFERGDHVRSVNGRNSSRDHPGQRGVTREQDITEMFEEHVPEPEDVLHQRDETNNKKHNGRVDSTGRYRRNTPLKAEKRLEEMTKSPELYNFQYESNDVPHRQGNLATKRSSSLTNLYNLKNSQFDDVEDDDVGLESWRSGFSSSSSIREAVFNEWLQRKQHGLKEKSKKKLEEQKKVEEKEKEKQERQLSAKKAFEVWSSKKEETIKDQKKKKKEAMNKEIDARRETVMKQQDAKKYYESWKSKKDELLKENFKEKKMKVKEEKKKEVEDNQEKTVIAKKSYEKWKARKDEQLKEQIKSKREEELIRTKYEVEVEMEKRNDSEKAFQKFLRKKGTGKRPPPKPNLTQRPWCPGGLTKGTNLIPETIQEVIQPPKLNRTRSFSGTTSTTSFHKFS